MCLYFEPSEQTTEFTLAVKNTVLRRLDSFSGYVIPCLKYVSVNWHNPKELVSLFQREPVSIGWNILSIAVQSSFADPHYVRNSVLNRNVMTYGFHSFMDYHEVPTRKEQFESYIKRTFYNDCYDDLPIGRISSNSTLLMGVGIWDVLIRVWVPLDSIYAFGKMTKEEGYNTNILSDRYYVPEDVMEKVAFQIQKINDGKAKRMASIFR